MPDAPVRDPLPLAYDSAMAVMTRPCLFVEWKIVGGGEDVDKWAPFGPFEDRSKTWRRIQGERWIYVFRRHARTKDPGQWVEEIHLDPEGTMSVTPMAEAMDPETRAPFEREKRPKKLVEIGKTISFARRIGGVAMEYYFFAARIRLPAAAITAIRSNIAGYAPPANFEPDDVNVIDRKTHVVVPVLDPITIVLHLHAYFQAAARDFLAYTMDPQRREVYLLAKLVQGLADFDVAHGKKLDPHYVDEGSNEYHLKFLTEYDAQVGQRLKWRDRWCGFLARWLASDTMKILAKAYLHDPLGDFHKFLIPFFACLVGVDQSEAGRLLLDKLYADRAHWVHQYALPVQKPSADTVAVIRKTGELSVEVLKVWLARVIIKPGVYHEVHVENVVEWVTGYTLHKLGPDVIEVPTKVAVVEVDTLRYYAKPASLDEEGPRVHSLQKIQVLIQVLNLCASVAKLDILSDPDVSDAEKAFVILNLAGSTLDLAGAVASLRGLDKKLIAKLGVVSALIDTVLAGKDVRDAWKDDDMGGVIGSGTVAAGSVMAAISSGGAIVDAAFATPLGLVALGVVVLGYGIKFFMSRSDTPAERFVAHCEWGDGSGSSTKPDWAPAPYSQWKGNYALQLRAGLNALCSIALEPADRHDGRKARVKLGWIPAGATLSFVYSEEWSDGFKVVTPETFYFDDKGLQSTSHVFSIEDRTPNGAVLRPHKRPDERQVDATADLRSAVAGAAAAFLDVPGMPKLKRLWVEAQLSIPFGTRTYAIPHEEPFEATLRS